MWFKNKKLNVLVIGTDGMFGSEIYDMLLQKSLASASNVGYVYGIDRTQLDSYNVVMDENWLSVFLEHTRKFDICINCVAMTDTAKAERDSEGRKLSYSLNAAFPRGLARICARRKIKLVHISTDYVFSTQSNIELALPDSLTRPINVYGTHKLLGEQFVQAEFMAANARSDYAILRTSWLYGNTGNKSFVHKILANAVQQAQSDDKHLYVTENEYSVPTSTWFLSKYVISLFNDWKPGISHAVPCINNNTHMISRYEWAQNILNNFCLKYKTMHQDSCKVIDIIGGKDFCMPVTRTDLIQPNYSAMYPSYNKHINADYHMTFDLFMTMHFNDILSWLRSIKVFEQ